MEKHLTKTNILKNILKNKIYRYMLLGSMVVAVLLPILAQGIVVPSFYEQMVQNMLEDAKRVGTHIARHQNNDVKSTVFYTALDKLKNDFKIIKIKLFDSSGRVVFSTQADEIGKLNDHKYFFDVVAKGEMFYKIVQKGASNQEGDDILKRDVAEIYVPIIKDGKFVGSSEIYYDITKKRKAFEKLMIKVSFLYYTFAVLFFISGMIMLYNASKANLKEKMIDEELKELNDSLKEKVDEKTKELTDINANLEKRINEEIAKNREKESHLFQQSKMASMGEMIGNIAHQWRQPLSAISSSVSSLKLQKQLGLATGEEVDKALDKILDTTSYLSNTINDFRDFFKSDKKKELTSLKKVLDATLSILSSTLKNDNIKVFEDISEYELNVFPNEFQQALLNIINNARDALIGNEIGEKYIFIDAGKQNENTVISIYDNAGGIPEDIKEKIFEPYFTTKHQSQGTGIGLYMTGEIIKKTPERLFGG